MPFCRLKDSGSPTSSTETGSSMHSSTPTSSLPSSSSTKTTAAAWRTMPVHHSRLTVTTRETPRELTARWDGPIEMYCALPPSGSISTPVQKSPTSTRIRRPFMLLRSANDTVCLRQYMLDRVTVSMFIGRWTRTWIAKSGSPMHEGSLHFVLISDFRLIGLGLRIARRFSEHPVPIIERLMSGWYSPDRSKAPTL